MSHSIPEYYRHFVPKESAQEDPIQGAPQEESPQEEPDQPEDPTWTYRAHAFTLALGKDWVDKTAFSLAGPITDGIQHLITVTVDPDVEVDAVRDYADWHTRILEAQLKGCQVLKRASVSLINGMPAYRVIYVWHPMEDLRLYQDQLYVLHEGVGYTLTASFTKKTRKTLGPQVARMMLSFNPSLAPAEVD
jgi:hypothetical protein